MQTSCPCTSGLRYQECCEPLHLGATRAATAEQLMRSRFSAFAVGDTDYILSTWHSSTRPPALELDRGVEWYRLDVIERAAGGPLDSQGDVDFQAFWRSPDGYGSQRERSSFVRIGGSWSYVADV